MPWSIFTDGGGDGAAVTWAKKLLAADNAPDTPANEQFIYDWEKSEGGGGKYNPLNQGPVPGHPELTTTGSQYGGGAADFASYDAGIQGAVDYLNMPNYTSVQAALKAGNASAARSALIASPWAASHYGNGASFSNAPLPGYTSSLIGTARGTNAQNASLGTATASPANWFTNLFSYQGQLNDLKDLWGALTGAGPGSSAASGFQTLFVRLGLILLGSALLLIGTLRFTNTDKTVMQVVSPVTSKFGGGKKHAS